VDGKNANYIQCNDLGDALMRFLMNENMFTVLNIKLNIHCNLERVSRKTVNFINT